MKLGKDISCEQIGDQWVVVSHVDGTAHHLLGDAATVIDYVIAGRPLPAGYDDTVNALVHAGILTVDSGWSRRQVLTTGAAAAAGGISSVALPAAALAASSVDPGTLPGPNPDPNPDPNPGPPEPTPDPNLGVTWLENPAAADNFWRSVTYGDDRWVAVSSDGANRVMTSTNGINWTSPADSPPANAWQSVAFGKIKETQDGPLVDGWVAVSTDGNNRAMISTNGTQWERRGAVASDWRSVAFGKIKETQDGPLVDGWVAVASSGSNRAMTSTNGRNWTARTAAGGNTSWRSVAFGKIKETQDGPLVEGWVAVASSGLDRVMTSTDGINWTARAATQENLWQSVAYGNGLWVAVSSNGTNRVMTSPDGINWTARAAAEANSWQSVAYGNGLWVAVSQNGFNRVMTSTNGINWKQQEVSLNLWQSVAYGDEKFVAVAADGDKRTMVSPDPSA